MRFNKKLMRLFLPSILLFLNECSFSNINNVKIIDLNQVNFYIYPHIEYCSGNYYMIYNVDASSQNYSSRLLTNSIVLNGKACYYFSGRASFLEYKDGVRRPVQQSFYKYAKADSIFWLNSDKSVVKLEIKECRTDNK